MCSLKSDGYSEYAPDAPLEMADTGEPNVLLFTATTAFETGFPSESYTYPEIVGLGKGRLGGVKFEEYPLPLVVIRRGPR